MKCAKCDGKGWYDNPKYPIPYGNWAGEPTINCKKCKGSGYIIGNVKDVLDLLNHLEVYFKYDKDYLKQVKQCINVIENE